MYHCDDTVPHAIVFYVDDDADEIVGASRQSTRQTTGGVSQAPTATLRPNNVDPELNMDNLCELKHHQMTRNERVGVFFGLFHDNL